MVVGVNNKYWEEETDHSYSRWVEEFVDGHDGEVGDVDEQIEDCDEWNTNHDGQG